MPKNKKKNKKKDDLTAFWRIFVYVKPQWRSVVAVVLVSFVIAILFALSFMTVLPLLKVMMNEEGLHGWVDRKTCEVRFGLDFPLPEISGDFGSNQSRNYLLVVGVDDKKTAFQAGLMAYDKIIGVGDYMPDDGKGVFKSKLLEELAGVEGSSQLDILVSRDDSLGKSYIESFKLQVGPMEGVEGFLLPKVKQAMEFVPRDQSDVTKRHAIIFIIVLMSVVTILRCFARFIHNYLAEKIVQVAIAEVREDCFAKVMEMPVGHFSVAGTSDTTSRIVGDTAAAARGIKLLLGKVMREPMKAVMVLSVAVVISPKLCLIFLGMAPVTIGLFGILGKRIRKATMKSLISTAQMLGRVTGVVSALRVVKVYNNQQRETEHYSSINNRLLRQTLRIAKVQAMTNPLMEVMGMMAGSAALLVGIYWVTSSDPAKRIDPSAFLTLLVLLGTAAESIRKVSDVWNKLQGANAASERVFEIIDVASEVEKPNAIELSSLSDNIEFRDITFTYPGNETPTLRGVNLTVKAGETVAVVGPNGSGKTTLINLIPRFYDPDSGSIRVDGRDIADCTLASLRGQIGMVTQNVVTFNESIADNIGYGKKNATQEEIVEAAKRSFAHEFIEPLPEGYDAVIGENSAGFSGGQLQRIVIARAIVKDPEILIFDEAMSQIDADSEAKINNALKGLIANRTCFVIAHRFSTVISADRIVVMEDGQVVAEGKHGELIESSALYRSLYETQLLQS